MQNINDILNWKLNIEMTRQLREEIFQSKDIAMDLSYNLNYLLESVVSDEPFFQLKDRLKIQLEDGNY